MGIFCHSPHFSTTYAMKKPPTRRNHSRVNKKGGSIPSQDRTESDDGAEKKKKESASIRRTTTTARAPQCKSTMEGPPEEDDTQKQKTSTRPGQKGRTKTSKAKPTVPAEVEAAVGKFMDYVNEQGVEGLRKEFDSLKTYIPPEYNFEAFTKNKEKNRFPDVVCLDATRVVLKFDVGNYTATDCDYIHANWINLEHVDRKFIAAQGPLTNTIEEFWRMVFQESVSAIVVVCKFIENEQPKCAEYWPTAVGGYSNFGKMFVNNKKVDQEDKFDTYTLEVLPDGCSNSHVTKLIHVTNWPDRGVPSSGRMVLRLLKMIKETGTGPVIVHCSAGIGRTGTILAIEAINTRLFKGKETTVKDVFTSLRNQRASCIQTEAQYLFVYTTVLDYIKAKMPQKYTASVSKFYTDLEKL